MNTIKGKYIFGALLGVMILTIGLSFFMNIQFIQNQMSINLYQEIEFTRELYKLKLLNLVESNNDDDLTQLFQGDNRSNNIHVLLYNNYGKNIAGNIVANDEGINNIKTMMLNGIEDTLYSNGTFYSFTNVKTNNNEVYIMLDMSDQKYIEGIRNYYFRTILIIVLVSVGILLIGFKLIEFQNSQLIVNDRGGPDENSEIEKKTISQKR